MPNDETLPSMRSHFHVAVVPSCTPSRAKLPGAVWHCSWLPSHPGPDAMRAEVTLRLFSLFQLNYFDMQIQNMFVVQSAPFHRFFAEITD